MKVRKLTSKKRIIILVVIIAIISMSLMIYFMGHFFMPKKIDIKDNGGIPSETTKETKPDPLRYYHLSEVINGRKQEINIIEADVSNPEVKIIPVLSSDLIYGFELLSSMAKRENAYAAVNGGFFSEYGLPSGMVIIDGKPITISKGKYPVFYISGGNAYLAEINSCLWLVSSNGELVIDTLNKPAGKGECGAYSPEYGLTNRAKEPNLTIVVRGGVITGINSCDGETEIPEDGMLVTVFNPVKGFIDKLPFKKGDRVELKHDPQIKAGDQAYECGSWIVRNGETVIGDKDPWIGVLTNQDPRTAVGIKKDGKVILMTVDGRQPGYSAGMTGKELAEFLLKNDIYSAAMLDGGASTEMILKGRIVNKPSFKGQERPIAGGLIVQYP
jgi:Exopolysaccharide biosynthesis protein related to N-acetylglucosamine-1-phosphodiester alpha-N-acetylglucosaminidase